MTIRVTHIPPSVRITHTPIGSSSVLGDVSTAVRITHTEYKTTMRLLEPNARITRAPGALRYILTPEDFDAAGDGVTADDEAFAELLEAAAVDRGALIMLGPKTYHLDNNLELLAPVTMLGLNRAGSIPSTLHFARGRGIIARYQGGGAGGSSTGHLQNFRIVGAGSSGAWSANAECVAGLTFFRPVSGYAGFIYECTTSGTSGGSEPTWPTTEGQTVTSGSAVFTCRYVAGVKMLSNSFSLERVTVDSILGDGFHVPASTGDGNNGNLCTLRDCRASSNLGHGFYAVGADANVVLFDHCSAVANGLGGFTDNSFLGCDFRACHTESNDGRPFSNLQASARSFFSGCYVESDQDNPLVQGRGMWFGGLAEGGVDGDGIIDRDAGRNQLYMEKLYTGVTYALRLMRLSSKSLLEFSSSDDSSKLTQLIRDVVNGQTATGWWSLLYNSALSALAISTDASAVGGGQAWLPNGFYAGAPDYAPKIAWGDNAPTSGTWKRGDTVFARAGLSGVLCWQCTAAGTPGTWQTLYRAGGALVARTTSLTLTPNDSGLHVTNLGASATVVVTLPSSADLDAANAANMFRISVSVETDAQILRLARAGSDVIRFGGASMTSLESSTRDDYIEIVYVGGGVFRAKNAEGGWSS